jgi:hypothetical protein
MPSLNTKLASAPNTTSGYVLRATSSTTIGNSTIQDDGTNVAIGTTPGTYKLNVSGTGNFTGALSGTSATFSGDISSTGGSVTIGSGGNYVAGSIYSDSGWGMLFRAKQASPTNAQFRWSNSTDATEFMRISNSGGLLVGTTPDGGFKLDIGGTSRFSGAATFSSSVTAVSVTAGSTSSTNTVLNANQLAAFNVTTPSTLYLNFTGGDIDFAGTKAIIKANGNVGIGTSDVSSYNDGFGNKLVLANTSGSTGLTIVTSTGGNGNIYFADGTTGDQQYRGIIAYEHANDAMRFSTQATERMRITSGGELYWNLSGTAAGNLNTGGALFRNNLGKYIQISTGLTTDASLLIFYKSDGAGGVTNTGSIATSGNNTLYNITSDYRLKEDLKDFNGIEKILAIKMYDFAWKSDNTRSYGVMAHELAEVLPYAVYGKKDEIQEDGEIQLQQVDYSKIVPILVKSIQELKAEIDELKNR